MHQQQSPSERPDAQSPETTEDRRRHAVPERPARALSSLIPVVVGIGVLLVAVAPAVAQTNVGDVYCGTGVETGITILFGAIAGLALPATGLYMTKSGIDYMRAGGDKEKKERAQTGLVMAATGFVIVVVALIVPGIIDNIGSQMGFGFSECVRPF